LHTTYQALGCGIVIIRIEGEIDAAAGSTLEEQLSACLDCGFRRLVLDMTACRAVDSTGLGALVEIAKRRPGGQVVAAAPWADTHHILSAAHPERALPVYHSVSEALRAP
jgi:anti-anti-sigma factor